LLRNFWAISKVEFLTRFRSNIYKVLLLLCVILPFWAVPKSGSPRVVLTLGPPDATFIGLVVAHISTLFIGLFSFYLVANSINYDGETSGKILCATPLHSAVYIMGKTAGSLFSLLPFLTATFVGAILVFFMRGVGGFQAWPLLAPSLATTLVMLWFVSCLAVFLDCFGIRGTLSRVIFGLFWFTSLMLSTASYFSHTSGLWGSLVDYMGQRVIHDYLFQEGISRVYTSIMHSSEAYVGILREGLQPMTPWVNSALFTAQRGAVFLFSTVLLVLAWLRFERFDPS
jgi:hypothetical protein